MAEDKVAAALDDIRERQALAVDTGLGFARAWAVRRGGRDDRRIIPLIRQSGRDED